MITRFFLQNKLVLLAVVLALLSVSLPSTLASSDFGCLNENGSPVDWWFIHKLPSITGNDASERGFAYQYMDPNTPLTLTGKRLDTNIGGALGSTLSQFLGVSGPGYMMWSDQPPDGTTTSRAHAKGVVAFNEDQGRGFFLRHSTPRFPNYHRTGPYTGLPDYERIYGQTFLCMSLSLDSINTIASQFLVNNPSVYDSYIPPNIASRYPNISLLADGRYLKGIAYQSAQIKTLQGMLFTDFAKSKYCKCELYAQLVAPTFQSPMAVLSWGRPLMSPGCKPQFPFEVLNINWISFDTPIGRISYNETKEHSKWGITENNNVVCVGDINRMTSQASRGGGTTCFKSQSLWTSMMKSIGGYDQCTP